MVNLLIVDDEELICRGIKSIAERMQDMDFNDIKIALNYYDALDLIGNFVPDIVVTDINMPEVSGLELIKKFQGIYKHTRYIVLSGYEEFQFAREALKLGAVDYILKPAKMEELKTAFEKAINAMDTNGEKQIDKLKADSAVSTNSEVEASNSVVEKAKSFVYNYYNKDINMAVVANNVSMSYTYFSRIFKDETGMNFSDYIIMVRMEEAKKILQNPKSKILQVSKSVGYDSPKHFTRAFRKYTGLSPKEYKSNE